MAHIITDTTVTLLHEGEVMTMQVGDKRTKKFTKLINKGLLDKAKAYYEAKKDINKILGAPFKVEDGKLYYYDIPTPEAISKRVITMVAGGFDIKYMLTFLERLYCNPSKRAVDELYGFLESNDLPITTDGRFLAYKRINMDWTDCYTSKIDNSIGCFPSMPRNLVDDNKDRTCSEGLHVASLEYLKHFHGQRLVAVAIDPADVVSVPTDYNNSKMRVCEYEVMEELDMSLVKGEEDAWDTPVYGDLDADDSDYDSDTDDDDDGEDFWCHLSIS